MGNIWILAQLITQFKERVKHGSADELIDQCQEETITLANLWFAISPKHWMRDFHLKKNPRLWSKFSICRAICLHWMRCRSINALPACLPCSLASLPFPSDSPIRHPTRTGMRAHGQTMNSDHRTHLSLSATEVPYFTRTSPETPNKQSLSRVWLTEWNVWVGQRWTSFRFGDGGNFSGENTSEYLQTSLISL